MNKSIKIAILLIALTSVFSYSENRKFGVRAGYFITSMDGDFPAKQGESIDNGFGFTVGLIIRESNESFDGEMSFSHRKIWAPGLLDSKQQFESALSIVVAYKFMLFGNETPLYLLLGPQFDIPLTDVNDFEGALQSEEKGTALSNVKLYLNLATGLGYVITDNFGIDVRCVIGFSTGQIKKGRSFNQYGAGVSYLF